MLRESISLNWTGSRVSVSGPLLPEPTTTVQTRISSTTAVIEAVSLSFQRQGGNVMENPLNNGCRPNEHYGVSETARLLGVTRPTIYQYIKLGYLRVRLHKLKQSQRIQGTDIIKFYNSIS